MTAIVIVAGLGYFIMKGVVEGMVMVQDTDVMFEFHPDGGPRGHFWFPLYHWFALARDVFLITAGVAAANAGWGILAAIPGLLVLGWELIEAMYSVSRYATLWPDSENILGTGIRARGTSLAMLHAVRWAGGIVLLAGLL